MSCEMVFQGCAELVDAHDVGFDEVQLLRLNANRKLRC